MDREEFYRLKKVKNNKQRDAAEADKAASNRRGSDKENQEGPQDLLGDQEDQDVIF